MRSVGLLSVFLAACSAPAPEPETGPEVSTDHAIEISSEIPAVSAQPMGTAAPVKMTRQALVAKAASGGFGRDYSWSRLGRTLPPGAVMSWDWVNRHPRLDATTALFGEAQAPEIFARAGSGTPPAAPTPYQWTHTYTAPVNATPAIYTASFTAQDPVNDRLYVYGGDGANPNFIAALNNFYTNSPPTEVWRLPINSAVNGSSIAVDITGRRMFAVSGGGGGVGASIWSVNDVDQTGWQVSWMSSATVSWSSPWVDYRTSKLYVGDEQDHIIEVNISGSGGTVYTLGFNSPIHATPLIWDNLLWVGNDSGRLVIYDLAGGGLQPLGAFLFCSGNGVNACTPSHAVWGTPYIDTVNKRALIGVNNRIFQIDNVDTLRTCIPAANCTSSSRAMAGPGINTGRFQSSVLVDQNGANWVYAGRNNRLARCSYTTNGGLGGCSTQSPHSAAMAGSGADISYPRSSPIQYPGSSSIYIGDGGGYMNRVVSGSSLTTASSFRPAGGTAVDSSPILDFVTMGNLYFGATLGSSGAYVQLPQEF
jgi:hypothetical protein